MIDGDRILPDALTRVADRIEAAVEGVAGRLRAGGRLVYAGAGTSGRLGVLDASEIPPTFGTPPDLVQAVIAGGPVAVRSSVEGAEDDPASGADDLRALGVGEADAVVGIAASGRTPYVLGALAYARQVGAFTVGVTANAGSEIGRAADVAVDVVTGPEFVAGSTRLRAGTAQKMVLNMITTLAMVRLGKTYGNLMVDVQASNTKLRARAIRIVGLATGADADRAAATLAETGGSVKEAILVIETGLDVESARKSLAEHDGFLRAAIEATNHSGRPRTSG
jgi:N-acetylmuramic acid 6-phosphate etherase